MKVRSLTNDCSEEKLQADLWKWAWNNLPHCRHHLWAVPNGIHASAIQASKAKATGMLSGVWDLHAYWNGKFHIIETKVGNNQLTRDRVVNGRKTFGQFEWGERMAAHGATRHVYRTLPEGQAILISIFGNPGQLT